MAGSVTSGQGQKVPPPVPGDQQLLQIADTFWATIGYDAKMTSNQLLVMLRRAVGTGVVSPADATSAYWWLFGQMSSQLQARFPGAQFGLDPQTFRVMKLQYSDAWFDLTGHDLPTGALNMAMQHGWSVSDLNNFVMDQALRKRAGGQTPSWIDIKNSPWLLSGVSYQSAAQQFASQDPRGPINAASVKGWWGFISGAREVGSAHPAQLADQQQREFKRQSETR